MVTYTDLIQFCILIVALVGLIFEICKGKKSRSISQMKTVLYNGVIVVNKDFDILSTYILGKLVFTK